LLDGLVTAPSRRCAETPSVEIRAKHKRRFDAFQELSNRRAAKPAKPIWEPNFKAMPLDALFALSPGDYHNASDLPSGDVPLISCGDADNGITGFLSVPSENIYNRKLTIAFNGMNTLTTKYHPYDFAAKDDVAVCFPRNPWRLSTIVFVQLMMAREKWRYSYYRKCFMDKLRRQSVMLPTWSIP
jgi:type I restriction enzyme M protein